MYGMMLLSLPNKDCIDLFDNAWAIIDNDLIKGCVDRIQSREVNYLLGLADHTASRPTADLI